MTKEEAKEMREAMLEDFRGRTPETRMRAYTLVLMDRIGMNGEVASIGTLITGLLYAAMKYPEWAQGVVRDQSWFKDLVEEENFEAEMRWMVEAYPMPVMRDERG